MTFYIQALGFAFGISAYLGDARSDIGYLGCNLSAGGHILKGCVLDEGHVWDKGHV